MDSEEFPANSKLTKPREPQDTKRVEKVVSGVVARRKKPLGKRFTETFVVGEAQGVGNYVFFEVLVPAVKDALADIVTQGIERILFGETRSASRRGSPKSSSSPAGGHVSYNRYASTPPWNRERRDEARPPVSRRARATHVFDEIILETRGEAEEVRDRLFDLVENYNQATVGDLYELVGLQGSFTDEKWGWTDLRGTTITRINSGYLLDLPRTESLD